MNKSELIQVFTALKVSYGVLFKYPTEPEDKEMDSMFEEIWLSSLKRYSYKEVMSAVRTIKFEGGQYPPHDGMIVNKILENQQGETMTAEEAWERGIELCSERHSYIKRWEMGVSEGQKFQMMDKKALENEDEFLRKTVNSLGGLNAIYDNPDNFSQSRFVKTYNSFKESITARNIREIAGVESKQQIENRTESTEMITEGLKKIGNK